MPTTTEVEARLRRAAQACEPLVEDLLGDAPTPAVVARRRGPARSWLVAAALLVVAGVGFAVVAAQDDPGDDVQADGGPTTGVPTTAPAVVIGPNVRVVLLADGTRIALGVPAADEWMPGDGQVTVELDGTTRPLTVTFEPRTAAEVRDRMDDVTSFEEVGDGVFRIDDGQEGYLVVERDGWSAVMLVSAEEAPALPLSEDVIAALADGLGFTVTPEGPVGITGPGLTVVQALRWVEADVPEGEEPSQLQVSVGDAPETCTDPSRTVRCFDGVRVVAWGAPAEAVLPEVTVTVVGDEETPGTQPSPQTSPVRPPSTALPVAFADGTTAELTLAPDPAWTVRETHAWVTIGSRPSEGHLIRFVRQDPSAWAAELEGDLATLQGVNASLVIRGADRWLLVERDGWTAVLAVAGEEAVGDFGDVLVTRLARELTFEVVDSGPTDLTGPLVTVTGVGAELRPVPSTDDPADVLLLQVGVGAPDVCDDPPNPQNRCLVDDRLVMTGLGTGGQGALAALTAAIDG